MGIFDFSRLAIFRSVRVGDNPRARSPKEETRTENRKRLPEWRFLNAEWDELKGLELSQWEARTWKRCSIVSGVIRNWGFLTRAKMTLILAAMLNVKGKREGHIRTKRPRCITVPNKIILRGIDRGGGRCH